MKQKTVGIIKRWPGLYRLAARVYYSLEFVHIAELAVGTRARERQWATRKIAEGYWKDIGNPSKQFFLKRIAAYPPAGSILEIGCASGANLYLLAKKYPEARLLGLDINAAAVKYGNEQLAKAGVSNVELTAGKADELEKFPDKAFDLVFTNALLIYIGPDKILDVIRQLLRVTRRTLMLVELHRPDTNGRDKSGLGTYQHDTWVRDYGKLLREFVPEDKIKITRIPPEAWPARPWRDLGAVIEVSVSQ